MMNKPLKENDPEIFDIIEHEKSRQRNNIALIASENFTSRSVFDCLGSCLSNKYSEGYPGKRYYGGNEYIDQAELLCQKRALEAFNLDQEKWGVNVQPLSGSPCNFAVYTAILQPHDRILAMDLPHGGHLSHGYQTAGKKISATSKYFECVGYRLNQKTGYIDYDEMELIADLYRPKLLIAGASAYPRNIDYGRMKANIADKHNAYLMADMAHISGLVSAGVVPSPFEYCDIVTTTTHKSLRGPRGAMIFYRKGIRGQDKKGKTIMYDLEKEINSAVFPGCQGGPHNHTISALATALKQCKSPEYHAYQQAVYDNCQSFANKFKTLGYNLVSGGTDNHLILVDVKSSKGIDGARVERVLELCNISANKNTIPGDKSAMIPGGLRLGTPAMTTRGLGKEDFAKVAEYVDRAVGIAININKNAKGKKLADFKAAVSPKDPQIQALKKEVAGFCQKFPTIGFVESSMRYPDAL